jgi:hypothetical protein
MVFFPQDRTVYLEHASSLRSSVPGQRLGKQNPTGWVSFNITTQISISVCSTGTMARFISYFERKHEIVLTLHSF